MEPQTETNGHTDTKKKRKPRADKGLPRATKAKKTKPNRAGNSYLQDYLQDLLALAAKDAPGAFSKASVNDLATIMSFAEDLKACVAEEGKARMLELTKLSTIKDA